MRTLLITGATGFVGRHAIDYALHHWPELKVIATSYRTQFRGDQADQAVEWVSLDMLDAEALDRLIQQAQPDVILHLAAASSVGYSWQHPRESTLNNLNIYLNLLEAVRHYCPQARILSVGSSEIYGQIDPKNLPLHEACPVQPVSPYAAARASQELMSHVYQAGYGLDIVGTRSFNHIGPGQESRFAVPSFARQIAQAKQDGQTACVLHVGNVDVVRDFTDVRDVVQAYFMLLENGQTGEIYNICSGQGRSLREVIHTLADQADMPVDIQIDETLLRPQDLPIIYGDNNKIKTEIGWTPTIEFLKTMHDLLMEWLHRENSVR